MSVLIPAGAVHRDTELYANPNEFDPEHFSVEEVEARETASFLGFGDGPRNCVMKVAVDFNRVFGETAALSDGKVEIMELLARYEKDKGSGPIAGFYFYMNTSDRKSVV